MTDPYSSLRTQLELQEWPNVYMFKFIIPNSSEKIALTMELFNESSDISMHESSSGKFVSITAKELMLDVDSIINKYKEATKIKGLMAL
jgi:putative lipoic acid-binding regulatory protein